MLNMITETTLVKWSNESEFGVPYNFPLPDEIKGYSSVANWWKELETREGPKVHLSISDAYGAGGWNEGGFASALTLASSIVKTDGELYHPEGAPCNVIDPKTFVY